MDKVVSTAIDAVADIGSGATLAVGGFGLCGVPSALIQALLDSGARDLELISNNAGTDDRGLGLLMCAGRVRRIIASYVGENKEFARQYLAGELEVELTPQGTLAERMRCGGIGIPAFFTATGAGTLVAEGGLPWLYDRNGNVVKASPQKQTQTFETPNGESEFVLEEAIRADFSLVRAWKGDRYGNLVYRRSARNFNPLAAMCGRVTIAEVEQLVEPGELHPDQIHTPGVFVHRVVPLTSTQVADKCIEKRTTQGPLPSSPTYRPVADNAPWQPSIRGSLASAIGTLLSSAVRSGVTSKSTAVRVRPTEERQLP
jgi:3-oxoacid CoA-transferase subunit A